MLITSTRSAEDACADVVEERGGQVARRRIGRHPHEQGSRTELGGRPDIRTPEVPQRRMHPVPVARPVRIVPRRIDHGVSQRRERRRGCDSPAAPSLHGSRLTRRGRLVVTAVWLLLAVVAVWPVLGGTGDSHGESRGVTGWSEETVPVRVETGDTLWELAVEADPHADPRSLIGAIVQINGLRDAGDIRPGDMLHIPVSGG